MTINIAAFLDHSFAVYDLGLASEVVVHYVDSSSAVVIVQFILRPFK